MDIIFNFVTGETYFVGIMNNAGVIPLQGDVNTIGIRFLPNSVPILLRGEAEFLANNMLKLDEVLGRKLALNDNVYESGNSIEAIVQFVEAALISLFRQAAPDHKWNSILNLITDKNGLITISELADYFTVSERHMTRRFQSLIGVSTKEFLSIIRFQSVLHNIKQTQVPINWSAISLQGGYYDQSHFINEFKKRYGLTPGSIFTG
nr:helix-turn-helix transcriptional regulator [Cohnella abietis]